MDPLGQLRIGHSTVLLEFSQNPTIGAVDLNHVADASII
jgi:hypothetical protein